MTLQHGFHPAATAEGFDASHPPAIAVPGCTWLAGYIGGLTPHIWEVAEWNAASDGGHLRMLPIWVADLNAGDPEGQAANAAAEAIALGWSPRMTGPDQRAIVLDMETWVNSAFVTRFASALLQHGFVTVPYCSATVAKFTPQCAGIWQALWDGTSALISGTVAHQYSDKGVAPGGVPVDLSVASDVLYRRMGIGPRR